MVMVYLLCFEQLLDKLVDNVLDYTLDQGRIWLKLRDHLTLVTLFIENEGPKELVGVADELFQLFSSACHDVSGVYLGLGLYIVRIIAEVFEVILYIESIVCGVLVMI